MTASSLANHPQPPSGREVTDRILMHLSLYLFFSCLSPSFTAHRPPQMNTFRFIFVYLFLFLHKVQCLTPNAPYPLPHYCKRLLILKHFSELRPDLGHPPINDIDLFQISQQNISLTSWKYISYFLNPLVVFLFPVGWCVCIFDATAVHFISQKVTESTHRQPSMCSHTVSLAYFFQDFK